jgi:hypothetical protein
MVGVVAWRTCTDLHPRLHRHACARTRTRTHRARHTCSTSRRGRGRRRKRRGTSSTPSTTPSRPGCWSTCRGAGLPRRQAQARTRLRLRRRSTRPMVEQQRGGRRGLRNGASRVRVFRLLTVHLGDNVQVGSLMLGHSCGLCSFLRVMVVVACFFEIEFVLEFEPMWGSASACAHCPLPNGEGIYQASSGAEYGRRSPLTRPADNLARAAPPRAVFV